MLKKLINSTENTNVIEDYKLFWYLGYGDKYLDYLDEQYDYQDATYKYGSQYERTITDIITSIFTYTLRIK